MNQAHAQNATAAGPGRRPAAVTLLLALVWLAGIVTAMAAIVRYANTPGPAGEVPTHWPAASRIVLDAEQPTLILFAHPHCPCTRASVGELAQLMADCRGRLRAQVWFVKPGGTGPDWTNTDLWASAARIPDVTVHCDEAGAEAQRFGADTSGQTVLYDARGNLQFQGGITVARGHFGDNAGRSVLTALAHDRLAVTIHTPVFGCPLRDGECRSELTAAPAQPPAKLP